MTIQDDFFDLTNDYRFGTNGVTALIRSSTLDSVAQTRAQTIADEDYFSHQPKNGKTAFVLLEEIGYDYKVAGENIARNNVQPQATSALTAMDGLINSPTHRRNMLGTEYSHVGIGIVEGGQFWIYVQIFATPKGAGETVHETDDNQTFVNIGDLGNIRQIVWQGLPGVYLAITDTGFYKSIDYGALWGIMRPNAAFENTWPAGADGQQIAFGIGPRECPPPLGVGACALAPLAIYTPFDEEDSLSRFCSSAGIVLHYGESVTTESSTTDPELTGYTRLLESPDFEIGGAGHEYVIFYKRYEASEEVTYPVYYENVDGGHSWFTVFIDGATGIAQSEVTIADPADDNDDPVHVEWTPASPDNLIISIVNASFASSNDELQLSGDLTPYPEFLEGNGPHIAYGNDASVWEWTNFEEQFIHSTPVYALTVEVSCADVATEWRWVFAKAGGGSYLPDDNSVVVAMAISDDETPSLSGMNDVIATEIGNHTYDESLTTNGDESVRTRYVRLWYIEASGPNPAWEVDGSSAIQWRFIANGPLTNGVTVDSDPAQAIESNASPYDFWITAFSSINAVDNRDAVIRAFATDNTHVHDFEGLGTPVISTFNGNEDNTDIWGIHHTFPYNIGPTIMPMGVEIRHKSYNTLALEEVNFWLLVYAIKVRINE